MKWTGIFPSGITAIGLSFPGEHKTLMIVLGLTISYLLCVFAVSAVTDFANWRHRFRAVVGEHMRNARGRTDRMEVALEDALSGPTLGLEAGEAIQDSYLYRYERGLSPSYWKVMYRIAPSAVGKALLDFVLPVFLGAFAAIYLFPPVWTAGILTCGYLVGFAIAYSQSRVAHPPASRAVVKALMSWLYIWRRNIEVRGS
jgi:hypothetical protein